MTSRTQWLVVGAILAGLISLLGVGAVLTSDMQLVGPGTRAPGFRAVRIATRDTVTLADYEGEILLLNVWATWCRPCEEEMPSIQRLHDTLAPSGLTIVAVSIDASKTEKVLEWVQERGLTFNILHDQSGRIERTYQTTGVPESYVIDRDGVIVKRVIGALEWDAPAQVAFFRRLLESADAPGARVSQES
jgi:peroxiredoxin